MNRFFLFFAVIAITPSMVCSAQSDYLVTNKGDTIRGNIMILTTDDRMEAMRLKVDKKKTEYTALQAPYLNIAGESYYAQKHGSGIKYMKLITSGFLSLYTFRMDHLPTFDGKQLVKLNGETMEVPNLRFKATMAEFLSDCESVSDQVRNGDFERGDLEKIITAYNDCMEKKSGPTMVTRSNEIASSPTATLVVALQEKVRAKNMAHQQDALDLLDDILAKVNTGKSVSQYQIDALTNFLKPEADLSGDLDAVLKALQK